MAGEAGGGGVSAANEPLDCRSETGITVGIIDGIITFCHLLKERDLSAPEVKEALIDMTWDDGFDKVLDFLIELFQSDKSRQDGQGVAG